MVTKIAQAFSDIGELLPQIDGLAKLYPVKHMKRAIANIYAQNLIFCAKATRWYKRNRVMHILVAVTRPWGLEFQDVVEKIQRNSQKIKELAILASQAELRDMHVSIQQTEKACIQLAFGESITFF